MLINKSINIVFILFDWLNKLITLFRSLNMRFMMNLSLSFLLQSMRKIFCAYLPHYFRKILLFLSAQETCVLTNYCNDATLLQRVFVNFDSFLFINH